MNNWDVAIAIAVVLLTAFVVIQLACVAAETEAKFESMRDEVEGSREDKDTAGEE